MNAAVLQIPIGDNNTLNMLLQVAFYLFFIVFLFYGQKIQLYISIRDVEKSLRKLRYMRDRAREIAIQAIKEIGKPKEDVTARVDDFLDYVSIAPVDMDPSGIVWKLEHLLDVRENRFKEDIKLMAPEAEETQINNLENVLEATMALNFIYKYIRHFYILGRKTLSLYIIMQLQMLLPLIMREAEAYTRALKAFTMGQPIGDGVGALVAAKLMNKYEKKEVAKDTVVAEVPINGRIAYVVKAKGPGGNVGKPGEGIKRILEEKKGKVSTVIMIDAGLKYEGERVGEIAEGVGAAIGGPGVEKFKTEEITFKYKVPVQAIIVKEDVGDAISAMRKELVEAADKVIERIKRLINEKTKDGDAVIIAGIGNTIGIAQ
ncbi:DUF1512 domain-containing protein [Candidatus Bathyarchaeota archaeon]|nr:DUF1512 domain-containing protein [Candidatus Bathyarchaeota archaeon]